MVAWTRDNETILINCFSGTDGPSGKHLVALTRHTDEVLVTFPAVAGREDLTIAIRLEAAEPQSC